MLIFGISGFISLERGIGSLLGNEIHHLDNVLISYVILAISFVFEANALRIAITMFKKTIEQRGDKFNHPSMFNEFKESKDTSI